MNKKISKLLREEAKKTMTDDEFFQSAVMKEHFEKIIEGVCKSYDRKLKIEIVSTAKFFTAMTEGNKIVVNLRFDLIDSAKTREEKYYLIVGIIIHECGHILYTDFRMFDKSVRKLVEENCIFPVMDVSDELAEMLAEKKGAVLGNTYKALINCIEDGHIEKRILRHIPGYGECLMNVRKKHIVELGSMPYAETKREAAASGKPMNRVAVMLDLILTYAKYGIDLAEDVKDDLTEVFDRMKPAIQKAVNANNSFKRIIAMNEVFDLIAQFITEETKPKEPEKKKSEKSEKPEKSEKSEKESKETEKSEEKSEEPEEGEGSEEEKEPGKGETESEEADGSTCDEDETEADGGDKSETAKADEDAKVPEEMRGKETKSLEDILSGLDEECKKMEDKTVHSSPEEPVGDDEEDGECESSETGDFNEKGSAKGYEGPKDWDLSYLEDKAADESAAKIIRNRIEKEMGKIADDTRRGRVDKFPSYEKYLEADEKAVEMYEQQHHELDLIAKRVRKNLDKVIKERQKGSKKNALYVGKFLDSGHAYRKDKKIFSNKILPEDVPDMEVCVLVDCSGSMRNGDRMEQARKCAYITWKFCQLMEIPCSVYGHTCEYPREDHVLINCVAHSQNADDNDEKRIFMLRPDANNRDGWALNFCCEALMRSGATSKLLLVISDGIPAARGYGMELGKRDCQEVVARYKKKGISVITAGIDSCAPDIKKVYLEGAQPKYAAKFLDFTDMSRLPKAFATIIKKELL